jgi:CarD family transcriptional regulator
MYGIHGVCEILALENRRLDRKTVQYYVLEPVEQAGARFYVPTQNAAAVAKLRPVMTKEQLDALLCSAEVRQNVWIADENMRKQRYRELISSGDRGSLLCMVRTLYRHKMTQQEAGRKFHLCDENFLRDAQRLLDSEFSLILGIAPKEVGAYIQSKLLAE